MMMLSVGGHMAEPGIELGTDSIGSVILKNGPASRGIVEQAVNGPLTLSVFTLKFM